MHSLEARIRLLLLGELKQFDRIGDPTHIQPIFCFPFERLLARHGFEIRAKWGFPLDGSSPTSRPGLRAMAGLARALGVSDPLGGDQLCLLIGRRQEAEAVNVSKQELVTAHY